MAITLRNKAVEEKIRRIGRRTGLGPSAVIAKAVEALDSASGPEVPPEEAARRLKALEALQRRIAETVTHSQREATRAFEADMYDEDGLPR